MNKKTLKTKAIAGIDYSMTSPAVCIGPAAGANFQYCSVYCFGSKKQCGTLNNIEIVDKFDYSTPEQRFANMARWVLNCIEDYSITHHSSVDIVSLEGYAFGSKAGQVFQIAENTGLLKHTLWQMGIQFETVPPTTLKKYVTDKGNAKKEAMYEKFIAETQFDIQKILAPKAKKIGNPVSDIVDAYYLYKYGVSVHQQ